MNSLNDPLLLGDADGMAGVGTTASPRDERACLMDAMAQVNTLVLGKAQQVKLAFACVLAEGHLLLEDVPGTGKTILARSLASVMHLGLRRVQFTSDLMPSDILGVSVYQPQRQDFELRQGPIFTHLLLADEINRASPRTQSALLEAMAEGQVSIDGSSLRLPQPFIVMATQNHLDMAGTFPLPAAQRDRFLFQLSLGYPDREAELALMRGERRVDLLERAAGVTYLHASTLMALRQRVRQVTVRDNLLAYIYALVSATRTHAQVVHGLSPRASLALVAATRAVAFLGGRDYATPEDVQEAFMPLAIHRVVAQGHGMEPVGAILDEIVRSTACP